MQGMSLVDILIWVLLLLFTVKGFSRGLIKEVCSLLGMLAGGWAGFKYSAFLAEAARPLIHLPPRIAVALSFILIFLLIGLLFFLLGHLLTVVLKIMLLGGINRIGGVIFGFLEGAFIVCMALYLLTTRPMPEKLKAHLLRSPPGRPFIQAGREIVAGWDAAKATKPGAR